MRNARHKCTATLQNKPVATNFWIAAFLGGVGDYTCQKYIEKKKKVDTVRLAAMTTFCGFYSGAACHYIFNAYNWMLPKFSLATNFRAGISKSLFDNLVHCPILYIPCFYVALGLMQGHGTDATANALEREWASSSTACAAFWTPVEAVIFIVVPQHFRILFVNVGNLVWNMFLSSRSQAAGAGVPAEQTISAVEEQEWEYAIRLHKQMLQDKKEE
jgi:protein Mpv17